MKISDPLALIIVCCCCLITKWLASKPEALVPLAVSDLVEALNLLRAEAFALQTETTPLTCETPLYAYLSNSWVQWDQVESIQSARVEPGNQWIQLKNFLFPQESEALYTSQHITFWSSPIALSSWLGNGATIGFSWDPEKEALGRAQLGQLSSSRPWSLCRARAIMETLHCSAVNLHEIER